MNNLSKKLREFLEKKPLYIPEKFELTEEKLEFPDDLILFTNSLTESDFNKAFTELSQIEMECSTCEQSRPFGRKKIGLDNNYPDDEHLDNDYSVAKVTSKIYAFLFNCHSCFSSEYAFFIEVDIEKCTITKVGQSPSWIPTNAHKNKDIYKFLAKKDAIFFKRALICQSHGFGIAAVSYYRRIVENSTDKILSNIRSFLESEKSSSEKSSLGKIEEKIEQIDKALKETKTSEKIKIAKDAIPETLKEGEMNPLTIIYRILSIGIHKLSEDECIKKCEDIQVALSYLIQKLPQHGEEKKIYSQALKRLTRKIKSS